MAPPKLYAYKGAMLTLKQIEERTGIMAKTLQQRMYSGMKIEEAVKGPKSGRNVRRPNSLEWKGGKYTLDGLAKASGISRATLQWRLAKGQSVEEATRETRKAMTYEYRGRAITARQAAEIAGVGARELRRRMKMHGLTMEEAVDGKFNRALYAYKGERVTVEKIAEDAGVSAGDLMHWMRSRNLCAEAALKSIGMHETAPEPRAGDKRRAKKEVAQDSRNDEKNAGCEVTPREAARYILGQLIYNNIKLERHGGAWIHRGEACTYAVTFLAPESATLEAFSNKTRSCIMRRRYAIGGGKITEVRE